MYEIFLSMLSFANNAPPTVILPAAGVPGGKVVIVRDRGKMKDKGGEDVKRVDPNPKK